MKIETDILKKNLLYYLAYVLLSRILASFTGDMFFTGAMLSVVLILAHFLILLVGGIISYNQDKKPQGRAQILTSIVILLIGMPVCFGIFSIGGFK
jgi:hypothetical protein